MKRVFLTFTLLAIVLLSQAQIVVKIGNVDGAEPGSIVQVPVSVSGMNGNSGGTPVTAIELHIQFPSANLTYDTTLYFSALTPSSQWFFGNTPDEYSTNWIEPNLQPLSIPDNEVLFEISFLYSGGNAVIDFNAGKCEILDASYSKIEGIQYAYGVITPSLGETASRWNGTGTWNSASNWSNGIPGPETIALIESGSVTVESNAVCKVLTINSGTEVIIGSTYSISVDSVLNNSGIFHVMSSATGNGSAIVNGAISGSGAFQTDLYVNLANGQKTHIGIPMVSALAGTFPDVVFEKYSENSSGWSTLNASGTLENGKGYQVSGEQGSMLQFLGVFPSGNVNNSNLGYSPSLDLAHRGLNLVANPYPSAINLNSGNWNKVNIDQSIYAWSGYKYVCWNGTLGSLNDGILPSMQGFFVRANAAAASFTIPADARVHMNEPILKTGESVSNVLKMKIAEQSDPAHFDEAFIHVLEGSGTEFDNGDDAFKFFGNDAYPQIFTIASDQSELAINTQPAFSSVPVNCKINQAGTYKISFSGVSSFPADQPLVFEDKATNMIINLRSTDNYVFITEGSVQDDRFYIHFQEVGLAESHVESFQVFIIEGKLNIRSDQPVKLTLFNLQGQVIFDQRLLDTGTSINLPHLVPGIYILKITAGTENYSYKLFLQ